MSNNFVLLLAAGSGSRFDPNKSKQTWEIEPGITLLEKTLCLFQKIFPIKNLCLVIRKEEEGFVKKLSVPYSFGGKTRQASVRSGLESLEFYQPNKVLIHDIARPFVTEEIVERILLALDLYEAVDLALPIRDTVKNYSGEVIPRDNLYLTQTPQGFHFPVILEKHREALKEKKECYTDDLGLYLGQGGKNWTWVLGSPKNKKITYKNDL